MNLKYENEEIKLSKGEEEEYMNEMERIESIWMKIMKMI